MKRAVRTVQVNVMMSSEERAWLEQVAERLGLSVSATVRWLVRREVFGGQEPALYETQRAGTAGEGAASAGSDSGAE